MGGVKKIFGSIGKMFGMGGQETYKSETIAPAQQNVTNEDVALQNDLMSANKRKKAGAASLETANSTIAGAAASGDKRDVTGA